MSSNHLTRFTVTYGLTIYSKQGELTHLSNDSRPTINEMIDGKEKPRRDRRGWVGFVEGDIVNFMQRGDLEKMTLDDGMGNKAKLTRRKDGSIFVECTSSNVL